MLYLHHIRQRAIVVKISIRVCFFFAPQPALARGDIVKSTCYAAANGKPVVGEYVLYKERFFCERSDFTEEYYGYNDEALWAKFGYDPGINIFTLKNGRCTSQQYEENTQKEDRLTLYLNEIAEKAFRKAILVPIYIPDGDGIFAEFEEEEK